MVRVLLPLSQFDHPIGSKKKKWPANVRSTDDVIMHGRDANKGKSKED